MGDAERALRTHAVGLAPMGQRNLAVALALLAAVLITSPVDAYDVYDSHGDQYEDAVTMKEDREVTDKRDPPANDTPNKVAKAHLDPIGGHPSDFAADAEDTWTQSADPWLKTQAKQTGPIKGDVKYKDAASDF